MNISIKASAKLLKEKDISPSIQRIRVLEYLQNSKNHPTVDNIYNDLIKEIPTLSKTTVYNILKLLHVLSELEIMKPDMMETPLIMAILSAINVVISMIFM